jgi:hypothetical protein
MNKSVELLLQRMKDHPEEFITHRATSVGYSMGECRFGNITNQIVKRKFPDGATTINGLLIKHLEFLPDEEIDALYQGLLSICEENFYTNIIDELANNNWEKQERPLWAAPATMLQPVHKPNDNPAQNNPQASGLFGSIGSILGGVSK